MCTYIYKILIELLLHITRDVDLQLIFTEAIIIKFLNFLSFQGHLKLISLIVKQKKCHSKLGGTS